MSIADAQARVNVVLRDLVSFFEAGGVSGRSIEILNDKIDKHDSNQFLALAESYGEAMAFLDHDFLVAKLKDAWGLLVICYEIEKKGILKKLKALREDKKAEPATVIKQENLLADIEHKRGCAMIEFLRLKFMTTIPIESFKDPNFDYKAAHAENEVQRKANQVINRQLGK